MSVVSFYSFKGGVGRTQAVANVATEIIGRGRRVVIVDMDLESPGVHAYFGTEEQGARAPGLLDYLDAWRTGAGPPDVDDYLIAVRPGIRVMGPGRLDATYARRVAALSWERFYSEEDGDLVMERLREELLKRADMVLLDSRTGMTDIGTICTFHLPDVVVALFALHRQGIDGTALVSRALAERMGEARARLKRVVLVPARVEEADGALVTEWIGRARKAFEGFPANIGVVEARDGTTFRVPYDRDVAYGEHVVVETAREGRLAVAYRFLVDLLTGEVPSREEEELVGWEVEAESGMPAVPATEPVRLRLARQRVARCRHRAATSVGALPELAARLAEFARLLSSHARRVEAASAGRESVELYRELARQDGPAFLAPFARALGDLSVHLSRVGRRAESLAAKEEVTESFRVLSASEPERFSLALAMSLNNLGSGLAQVGRYDEALVNASEAVELYKRAGAPDDEGARSGMAMALGNLASILFQVGRWQDALHTSQETVAVYRLLDGEQPDVHRGSLALSLNNLSNFLAAAGNPEAALAAIRESLTLYQGLEDDQPDVYRAQVAMGLFNIGIRLVAAGDAPAASAAVTEAIARYRDLAAEAPDAFVPELARSLAVSSVLLDASAAHDASQAAAAEALSLIRPFCAQLPVAFAEHATLAVNAYLTACTALDQPPDEALLAGLPRPEPPLKT